jgi:hypothetical protein
VSENKASLERQKNLELEIKSLQEQIKIDRHRSDFQATINELRSEIEDEKSARREWAIRRALIDAELKELRAGGLAGVRIQGRRPTGRPSGGDEVASNDNQGGLPCLELACINPVTSEFDPGHGRDNTVVAEDSESISQVQLHPTFQRTPEIKLSDSASITERFSDSTPVLDSIPSSLYDGPLHASAGPGMSSFEHIMFNIPSDSQIDPAFNIDEFLPEFDPSTFDFAALGTHREYSADELEYIGPPTVAQPVELTSDHLDVGNNSSHDNQA